MNYSDETLKDAVMVIRFFEKRGVVHPYDYEALAHRMLDFAGDLKCDSVENPASENKKLYKHYYSNK